MIKEVKITINEWNEKINEEFNKHIKDDPTRFKGSVKDFFDESAKLLEEEK
jgi:hypothetical protein